MFKNSKFGHLETGGFYYLSGVLVNTLDAWILPLKTMREDFSKNT
jgi:hypothetical protein